jgi:hypothetical protein
MEREFIHSSTSVDEFLAKVDEMSYKERVAYAYRMAQVLKGDQATEFVAALRTVCPNLKNWLL